ncbi:hypothetical protein F5Y04DRAFT_279686 [Hypomontagnella monticulosa]|nr:hypothetical protein F5Y04DRAFT_279686 [Hypomontagnella monticulosa]
MGSTTETTCIPLTPLDHYPPGHYAFFGFFLPLNDGVTFQDAYKVLQKGLLLAFSQLPWLGGKVYYQSPDTPGWRPGQLEMRYEPVDLTVPGPYQLKYRELETDVGYEGLKERGFPLDTWADSSVMWSSGVTDDVKGAEVFVAQANFIPGGCFLTAGLHHCVGDGTSTFDVLKIWADNCHAVQSESWEPQPIPPESSDRNIMERIWEKENTGHSFSEMAPDAFRLLNLQPPGEESKVEMKSGKINVQDEAMQAGIFYISAANFNKLRQDCARDAGDSISISGVDALCALVWRTLIKARRAAAVQRGQETDNFTSTMFLTSDGRPNFSNSMPSPYFGNVVLMQHNQLPLPKLTGSEANVGSVSRTIRTVANRVTAETVLDAYAIARSMDDYSKLTLRLSTLHAFDMLMSVMVMVQEDLVCFRGGIFANGGMPDTIRPLMDDLNRFSRICYLMPRKKSGGVELVVNLFADEMEFLFKDPEFGGYASYVSS